MEKFIGTPPEWETDENGRSIGLTDLDGSIVRIAAWATDASGNPTGLTGPDGLTHATLGRNIITVGNGGMYATIQSALDYIATQDTYTELAITGTTSSITSGTKLVTVAVTDSYTFDTYATTVNTGDLWSGDGGTTWFEIDMNLRAVGLTLKTPYMGTTLSGASTKFARPIWYSIVLLPGTHGYTVWPVAKAMFVDIKAMPGAIWVDRDDAQTVQQTVFFPKQGHVILRDVVGIAPQGRSAWCASLANTAATASSIVEFKGCDIRSQGVDVWLPGAYIGLSLATNSYFEAGQDVFVNAANGGMFFTDCEIVGTTSVDFIGVLSLNIRIFAENTYARRCTLRINIPEDRTSTVSYVVDATYAKKYYFDQCLFEFNINAAATKAAIIATSGGVAQVSTVELNNCVMRSVHASGTPNISHVATYTGAGTLKLQNCVKNGFVNGGGGTLTTNTTEANCSA